MSDFFSYGQTLVRNCPWSIIHALEYFCFFFFISCVPVWAVPGGQVHGTFSALAFFVPPKSLESVPKRHSLKHTNTQTQCNNCMRVERVERYGALLPLAEL